jgi:hypothetical protein
MESQEEKSHSSISDLAMDTMKMILSYVDYYSTKTIDAVGNALDINVNGKPLSKQSTSEMTQGLESFSKRLKDPRIQAALMSSIKDMKPIVREAALSYMSIAIEMGKLAYREAVDTACFLPPFSFVCSGTMMLDAANKFGEKVLEKSVVLQDIMAKASTQWNELSNKIKGMPEYNSSMQSMQNISNRAKNLTNISPNISPNSTLNQQKGGLKKTKKYRKYISRRINKSIKQFLNTH